MTAKNQSAKTEVFASISNDEQRKISKSVHFQDMVADESERRENETFPDYRVNLFGANLPKNTPAILYLGDKAEKVWTGVQQTGLRLVSVELSEAITSHRDLFQLISKAMCYIFDHVTSSGVYFVGHGVGALLVAKLLAARDLLRENSRLERLQAAFLVSGIYDSPCGGDLADDPWLSAHNFRLSGEEIAEMSPLRDKFDHLWTPGTRIYVFSAQGDGADLRVQSRLVFERLSEGCDQNDTHYEIKERVNRADLLECMSKPNNFLSRLIRYDIGRSQSRYY